jgi:hypothetical protein
VGLRGNPPYADLLEAKAVAQSVDNKLGVGRSRAAAELLGLTERSIRRLREALVSSAAFSTA